MYSVQTAMSYLPLLGFDDIQIHNLIQHLTFGSVKQLILQNVIKIDNFFLYTYVQFDLLAAMLSL